MEEPVVESAEAAEETVVEEEVQAEEPAEEVVEEEPVEAPPPKPKQTAQERINELTRIRREKEREAEYWKKVALEKQKETPRESPAEPSLPARPKLEQFESTEQYEDALFEWRDSVQATKSAQKEQEERERKALNDFNERARKVRLENPDFDEVVESPVFSPGMRAAILLSENGPELAYYLGKEENRTAAERIRNLPTEMQHYELGKLEYQLQMAKKTKKVPSAPEPIKPIGMSGAGGNIDPSKMSTAEWIEWDRKRELEKLKARLSGG